MRNVLSYSKQLAYEVSAMDTAQFFCPNKDSKRQLLGVHRRMVFGSVAELRECFEDTPLSLLLTTSHIERDHFACRLPNSRLASS